MRARVAVAAPLRRDAAKAQVATRRDRPRSPRRPGGDQSPDPRGRAAFALGAGESLWELQAVLDEPGCLGDTSVEEAATSLGSELVGAYRDEEVTRRLAALVAAEAAGDLRTAARHLGHVRRKLAALGVVPVPSTPLDPSACDEYPAWRRARPRGGRR